jgi:hypothetical protein
MYSYWGTVVDAKKQKHVVAAAAKVCDLPDFFETLTNEDEEETAEVHHQDD